MDGNRYRAYLILQKVSSAKKKEPPRLSDPFLEHYLLANTLLAATGFVALNGRAVMSAGRSKASSPAALAVRLT